MGELKKLVQRREAAGLDVAQAAEAIGRHPTYLAAIEAGRQRPTWSVVAGLSILYDVPILEFAREIAFELPAGLRRVLKNGKTA